MTTDRKVLAPSGGDGAESSGLRGGFCGLALLDLRKRLLVRRLQVVVAAAVASSSGWSSPLTSGAIGTCPSLGGVAGTEVETSTLSSSGEWAGPGVRRAGETVTGASSGWVGTISSSGSEEVAGRSGGGEGGGRDFLRPTWLRTSRMVFFSSFSLLLRDGLCFMAALRSSFSSSSVSCSCSGVRSR